MIKSQIPKANAFSHTASMLRNYVSRDESGVIWREGGSHKRAVGMVNMSTGHDARTGKYYKSPQFL